MAIQTSIITFKGKLDNTVGQKSFGNYSLRKKVKPRNPKSQKQLEHRLKFSIVGKFAGKVAGFINQTFKNSKKTAFSMFIDRNFENIIGGTYPAYELLFNKTLVSQGTLDLPDNPSAAIDSQTLSVSWNDNSGLGKAQASDKAALLVYNSVKDQSVYSMEAGTRADRQASLVLPTAWSGDSVDVWFSMHAVEEPNNGEWCDSVYLGNFSI